MESALALDAQTALLEAVARLTPEERLNAFLNHCELIMELRPAAGAADPGPAGRPES